MIELVSPFPIENLPRVWRWVEAHKDKIADDYFAKDCDAFIAEWISLQIAGRKSWGVIRGGVLGGVVTSRRLAPTVADFHCLFSTEFWGRDTVVPALEQVCSILFEDETLDKLSTLAFAKNMSLAGMIRHFGVTREGLLYGHTRQNGKLVDLQMLGLQRERFNVIRSQRSSEQPNVQPGRTDKEPVQQPVVADGREQHVGHNVADRNDGREQHGQPSPHVDAVPGANPAPAIQADPAASH